jgi:hypothetical protein
MSHPAFTSVVVASSDLGGDRAEAFGVCAEHGAVIATTVIRTITLWVARSGFDTAGGALIARPFACGNQDVSMCADRETFAEPPSGGVWEVRVADGRELVDGGHRHMTSQPFVESSILIAIKGDICSRWRSGKMYV